MVRLREPAYFGQAITAFERASWRQSGEVGHFSRNLDTLRLKTGFRFRRGTLEKLCIWMLWIADNAL